MARAQPRTARRRLLALACLSALAGAALLLWRPGRGAREEAATLPPAAGAPPSAQPRAGSEAPAGDARRLEQPADQGLAPAPASAAGARPGGAAPAAAPREQLTGTVTDEAGRPLSARVSLHQRRAETDPRTGAFALDLAGWVPLDDPLIATARGHAPAVLEGVGQAFLDGGRTHPPLAIVLSPAGRLAGVVRRHGGEPAAGVLVAVREAVPDSDGLAERSASSSGLLPVETGPDGAFALDGLRRAPYTLIAVDPVTLARAERSALPDAEGLELRLPAPARRDVAGVARFPDGTPAEGRTISAFVSLPGSRLQPYRVSRAAHTDADGAFVLADLPAQDLQLFAGPEIHPWSSPLSAQATRVELVLDRLCTVDVRWPAGSPAPDTARALSAEGGELPLYRSQWGAIRPDRRLQFVEVRGAAPPELTCSVLVPESASALLFERAGQTLKGVPVAPRCDVETVARP